MAAKARMSQPWPGWSSLYVWHQLKGCQPCKYETRPPDNQARGNFPCVGTPPGTGSSWNHLGDLVHSAGRASFSEAWYLRRRRAHATPGRLAMVHRLAGRLKSVNKAITDGAPHLHHGLEGSFIAVQQGDQDVRSKSDVIGQLDILLAATPSAPPTGSHHLHPRGLPNLLPAAVPHYGYGPHAAALTHAEVGTTARLHTTLGHAHHVTIAHADN